MVTRQTPRTVTTNPPKTANNLINNYLFGRTQLNGEKWLLPMKKTGGYTNINIKEFWDDNK